MFRTDSLPFWIRGRDPDARGVFETTQPLGPRFAPTAQRCFRAVENREI